MTTITRKQVDALKAAGNAVHVYPRKRSSSMTINYKYFLLYKRLSKRFKLATIERHWEQLTECQSQQIVEKLKEYQVRVFMEDGSENEAYNAIREAIA